MKKLFALFSSLALVAAGLLFSGCTDEVALGANYWYKDTYEKENNTLVMYYYYTETEQHPSGLRSDVSSIPAGLTVILRNDSSSTVMGIANNSFIMKTFANGTTVGDDGEESSDGFTMSASKWDAFYLAMAAKKPTVLATQTTTLPPVLQQDFKNTFTNISDGFDFHNLSWKSVLISLLSM